MPVYWYDGLATNIEAMDSQHQQLLRMINDLEDALGQRRGVRELTRISDRMLAYAHEHFAMEEGLMNDHGYPGREEHMAEHETFRERVMAVEFLPDEPDNAPAEVLAFLRDWLVNHIHVQDGKLGEYLVAREVA